MAVALCGAVVTETNGTQMTYKKKCEKCGNVEPGETRTSAPSKSSKLTSSFMCSKCRNQQKIEIQG